MKITPFIWRDKCTGAAVSVNAGFVEIRHGDPDFHRLSPDEAAAFADSLVTAVTRACAYARRWNNATHDYDGAA